MKSIFIFLLTLAVAPAAPETGRPPNIVVIFMDDLGYADIGAFGAKGYETPNLDRLAKEGTKFTSFYAAQAVCSASRAALLTGCYPNRIGITGALMPHAKIGLNPEETTLAEICKSKGYATGVVGKWHLGDELRFLPTRHGFDEFFGLPYSNDMTPDGKPHGIEGARNDYPPLPLIDGEAIACPRVTDAVHDNLTTLCTERATNFIRRHKDKPFFLYMPHAMVHVPLYVSEKFRGKSKRGLFGDVMMEVDWSVGEILKTLKDSGVDDHTLVVFTSDNGPWLRFGDHAGSAAPLREGKGTSWDGGVREPTLMRWPGKIPAGRSCDAPLMTIDLLPTVAGLIGAELPQRKIDGLDIAPVMFGKSNTSPHDVLYFYYHANDLEALRSGHWKIELPRKYQALDGQPAGTGGKGTAYKSVRIEKPQLYDLNADPGQTRDLAESQPDVLQRLLQLADQARADLGDGLTGAKGPGRRNPGRIDGQPVYPDSFPASAKPLPPIQEKIISK